MARRSVLRWVAGFRSSSTELYECRHCGYTIEEGAADECPKCGSKEIASYDIS